MTRKDTNTFSDSIFRRVDGEWLVRISIWVYFWLIILEGPLRKWILPKLANELILVRDPVVLIIYALCLVKGRFKSNPTVIALLLIGLASIASGMLLGTGNLFVTLYGFDSIVLHLPLIFVIGGCFDRSDVVKSGRAVLWLVFPMTILMIFQFKSSSTAFINAGPGGALGSQMQGALGKIRPPGLFTFITGAAQFIACATAFVVVGLLDKKLYNRALVFSCGVGLILCTVVSTSRLTLGGIGLVFLMIGVIGLYNKAVVRGVVGMLLPLGVAFFVATTLDVFHEGKYVFEARMEETGEANMGLAQTASNWSERILGDFMAGIKAVKSAPLFGFGLGYGTNVGARILTGKVGFSADEREWGRVVLEIGPLLGIPYLLIRIGLVGMLFRKGATSAQAGNFLPLMLLGSFGLPMINGQFGVASTVGFTVMGCGLCLAANRANEVIGRNSQLQLEDVGSRNTDRRKKGKSVYSEKIHPSVK